VTATAPDAGRIRALAELARRRVEQGFPLEALTRSIQITARFVLAAFDEEAATLEVAQTFGMTGVVTIADLGPLRLARLGTDTVAQLERQHLHILDDGQPGRRDMENTVWVFLEHDRNIDQTALDLHVHRNTVRYRLARFQELTHLDLRHTRDVVLAWWLLAHRRVRRRDRFGSPCQTGMSTCCSVEHGSPTVQR
jgi:DNA-binding PucR family transcriptional regulator